MSKYDSIKTAADLVAEVKLHGLSTDQEDICRAQDIFGSTPTVELAILANDIGQNNHYSTQGTFYMIVSHIWNWEEVTRFWNQHTNPQTEELKKLRSANKELTVRLDKLLADQKVNDETVNRLERGLIDAQRKAEEAGAEVVSLKAKLYDLLVAKKGDDFDDP